MAHRNQIEKLTAQRNKLLEGLSDTVRENKEAEVVDIQDLISGYKNDYPFSGISEIREYLINLLEKEYGIGIVESYPMIDAAIGNELFRYRLRKRK